MNGLARAVEWAADSTLAPTSVTPAAGRPTQRPRLVVVARPEPHGGRSAFVAVLAGLLVLGLAALLGLNTVLAQDAFVLSTLNQQRAELAIVEQSLAGRLADQEDPQRLALRAKALGLRPAGAPLFLRLPDGKVLGSKRAG